MTTPTVPTGEHRFPVLSLLVPGPLALSMRAGVDPSGWHALRTRRYLGEPRTYSRPVRSSRRGSWASSLASSVRDLSPRLRSTVPR